MDTSKINAILNVLVDVVDPQGIPESFIFLAIEEKRFASRDLVETAIAIGIAGDLFRRENNLLFPGSKFAQVKEAKREFEKAQRSLK